MTRIKILLKTKKLILKSIGMMFSQKMKAIRKLEKKLPSIKSRRTEKKEILQKISLKMKALLKKKLLLMK